MIGIKLDEVLSESEVDVLMLCGIKIYDLLSLCIPVFHYLT
ncbi:hypothetical protein [Sulfurimonas sp.]